MSKQVIATSIEGKEYLVSVEDIQHWHVSAYGLVVRDGKILLLVHEGLDGTDRYSLPGGMVEFGESFEEAVEREVLEETGVLARVGAQLSAERSVFIWQPDIPTKREVMQSVLIYYVCDYVSGDVQLNQLEEWEKENIKGVSWVSLEKAAASPYFGSFDYRPLLQRNEVWQSNE